MRFNALITFFCHSSAPSYHENNLHKTGGERVAELGTGNRLRYRWNSTFAAEYRCSIFYSETSACLSWPCQKFFQLKINDFIDMTSAVSRFSNSILCIMFYKKWLKLFHFKVTVLSWHWANFINNFLPVVRRRRHFSSLFLQGRKFTAAVNEIKDHCTYDRFLFPNLLSSLKNVANQFVTC